MTDELKPVKCGCGGEAVLYVSPITTRWHLQCESCKIETAFYDTEAEAITAWNRAMGKPIDFDRDKERTAKVKNYQDPFGLGGYGDCSECGAEVNEQYAYCPNCGCRLEWE